MHKYAGWVVYRKIICVNEYQFYFQFLEIAFSNTWEEAVCKDVTTFAETFRIPVDSSTNITLLQQDLCEDLSKKDSTLNSLLQRLDMNDVFKAVS